MTTATEEQVTSEPTKAPSEAAAPTQVPADDPNWLRNYIAEQHATGTQDAAPLLPAKKSPVLKIVLLAALLLMAAGAFLLKKGGIAIGPVEPKAGTTDLGQGISSDAGLRGHLVAEWKGKALYRLKIEPIDPRDDASFRRVTESASQPLSINLRILDNTGQALCGKQVVLAPRGAPAAPDQLQRLPAKKNGDIDGLWAEGTLPCSPDQYTKFDYWDMATTFPVVAQQDKMAEPKSPAAAAASESGSAADRRTDALAARRRLAKKPGSAFYIEGDDHAVQYEPARNLLSVGPDHLFTILRAADAPVAAQWADYGMLVHYTCDQHSMCTLQRAGSPIVSARMN